jgi:NAD(P)-dependent dehydrogenase (short-subunit alcohol dehydrogenase family)
MKNYLIIGGSSGIGLELALQLAELGHYVTATFNTHNPNFEHKNIRYHQLNVMDDNASLDFIPNEIDGFIYCPGSINLRPFERINLQDFESDYKLQVLGAIKILHNILPVLKKSDTASILLFSTVAVQTGFTFHSQVAASKGAIEGLTKALAAEYAPKIRVNCIAPSLTNTPLAASFINNEQKLEANANRHPLKRIGSTKDITNMAIFLLSEKASWITGQIMKLDGGMSTLKV